MATRYPGAVTRQLDRLLRFGTVAGLTEGQLLERYATRRDEAAFEALVARHGPMVLAVCHGVLRDPHAVDDAFQATFLILARKAGTIRRPDRLGPWLHGVARRVAVKARADAARRAGREVPEVVERGDESDAGRDLEDLETRAALHEELDRLPAKYRDPIVLCHLQGLTHDQAADRLRWPVGTVRGRLARGRDLLRDRLSRRGLAPSAGLLAALLCSRSTSATASIPPALLNATLKAASAYATGTVTAAIAAGTVSATVAALSEGVLKTMITGKLTTLTGVVLLSVGATAAATGFGGLGFPLPGAGHGTPADPPENAPAPVTVAQAAPAPQDDSADETASESPTPSELLQTIRTLLPFAEAYRKHKQDEVEATRQKLAQLVPHLQDEPAPAPLSHDLRNTLIRYQRLKREVRDLEDHLSAVRRLLQAQVPSRLTKPEATDFLLPYHPPHRGNPSGNRRLPTTAPPPARSSNLK